MVDGYIVISGKKDKQARVKKNQPLSDVAFTSKSKAENWSKKTINPELKPKVVKYQKKYKKWYGY